MKNHHKKHHKKRISRESRRYSRMASEIVKIKLDDWHKYARIDKRNRKNVNYIG